MMVGSCVTIATANIIPRSIQVFLSPKTWMQFFTSRCSAMGLCSGWGVDLVYEYGVDGRYDEERGCSDPYLYIVVTIDLCSARRFHRPGFRGV